MTTALELRLNMTGTPAPDLQRIARPIAPEFKAGTALVNAVPIVTFLVAAGVGALRVRGLFTAGGTLQFAFVRPPPNVDVAYGVEEPPDVVVVADAEFFVTVFPQGECYLRVTFTPAADGVVTFFDQMQSESGYAQTDGRMQVIPYYWDPDTLMYVVATTSSAGTGADVIVTNTVAVTGPLTDTQLRASPVHVSTRADLVALSPTAVVVGVGSAVAVAANGARTGLKLRNLSTGGQVISLAYDGAAAVLRDGDTLYPLDAFAMDEYDFTTGEVAAIASAAGAVLAIQELQ